MTDPAELLASAREAHARHDWTTAHRAFTAARQQNATLDADDLDALSDAAWWLGAMNEMFQTAEESFDGFVRAGHPRRAGMVAINIGFLRMMRGEMAAGSGWLARGRRLIEDEGDCVERGYLGYSQFYQLLAAGDIEAAVAIAKQTQDCARRFGDATLEALGRFGEGLAMVRSGDVEGGMAAIDETMLSVVGGRVAPAFAGNIYCGVIGICAEIGDLARMREWTAATERWCATFPSAVMFQGICRAHRAQLDVIAGNLDRAEAEARRVFDELADMNVEMVAEAWYQLGEIRRLRGETATAEDAYETAHGYGRDPQPGLALLRLDQGQARAARASIDAALAAASEPLPRAALLPAHVAITIAAGDVEAAARSAAELDEIAATYATPGFQAAARHARGALLLAQDAPADAAAALRDARARWVRLGARGDAARAGLLLADASQRIGDADGAERERRAARELLAAIGAAPASPAPAHAAGLSERELDVLRRVAAGDTNRQIGAALHIAEKTVARHLSNIFTKLGVASRTAAAAWAYEHGFAPAGRDG